MPSISVIIPTFNRLTLLKRAIGSVLAQTYRDFELIVIDNSSSDGTLDYITKLHDCRIKMKVTDNGGVIARSRNIGLDAARGDYIAFLDSDDYWFEEKLSISLAIINQGYDLVYHDLFRVKDQINKLRKSVLKTGHIGENPLSELLIRGNLINSSSVVCRAKCFEHIRFNESQEFVGVEDYICWLDIASAGNRFHRINKPLGGYGIGQNISNDERTVDLMQSLTVKIESIATHIGSGRVFSWPWIEMGISFYRLGKFKTASLMLVKGLNGCLHPRTRIKGIYFFCLAVFKRVMCD